MVGQIRILILQDEGESELLEYELSKSKIPLAAIRVESQEGFFRGLREFRPDLILAGPQPATIDGRLALAMAQEECPEVPFIFISGDIGKGITAECACPNAAECHCHNAMVVNRLLKRLSPGQPGARPAENEPDPLPAQRASGSSSPGEDHFGALFQTVGSMVAFLSPECRILEFNQGAERLTGWQRKEVLGKDVIELFVPEAGRSSAKASLKQVLGGAASTGFDLTIKLRNGTERFFLWTCNLLSDNSGHPSGIMVVGQDITEQKPKAAKTLPAAGRMARVMPVEAAKRKIVIRRTGSC